MLYCPRVKEVGVVEGVAEEEAVGRTSQASRMLQCGFVMVIQWD